MPYLFIIIGLVMVTAAVRNTVADFNGQYAGVTNPPDGTKADSKGLTTLIKRDFTGDNNFTYWVLSILVIGAVGYIKPLEPVSRAFMLLVIIVLVLSNRGVFAQFNAALEGTQKTQVN
jgi:hypothetical protein